MMAVTALALFPSDAWPARPGSFRAAVESFPKQEGSHVRGQITAIAVPASSPPPRGRTRHAKRRLRLAATAPAVQADGDATEER
jgi:hypothetical protein